MSRWLNLKLSDLDNVRKALVKIVFPTSVNSANVEFLIYKKVSQAYELQEVLSSEYEDVDLIITGRSAIKTAYDFDNLFLVATDMDFELIDGVGYLKSLIADSSEYEKDFYVFQKVGGESLFSGKVIPKSLSFLKRFNNVYSVGFKASTPVDRLNYTFLQRETTGGYDEPTNPLGAIDSVRYNMLYTGLGSEREFYFTNDYVKVSDFIKDIYNFAGIEELEVSHNWLFKAEYILTVGGKLTTYTSIDIPFIDVYINPSFYLLSNNFQTLGDVLRHLGKVFGAYTGIKDFDTAFFNKLFYGTAAIDPFDSDPPSSYKETYELDEIDYVKITDNYGDSESRYFEPDFKSINTKSSKSIVFEIPKIYIQPAETSTYALVLGVKDLIVNDEYLSPKELIAKFWYTTRGDYDKSKTYTFRYDNLDKKNITDLIRFGGESYQPYSMEVDVVNNKRVIKTIKTLG